MKLSGSVQKSIRIEAPLFVRIANISESLKMASQNELFNHILKAGIEALEEREIDNYIENPPDPIQEDSTGDAPETPFEETTTGDAPPKIYENIGTGIGARGWIPEDQPFNNKNNNLKI